MSAAADYELRALTCADIDVLAHAREMCWRYGCPISAPGRSEAPAATRHYAGTVNSLVSTHSRRCIRAAMGDNCIPPHARQIAEQGWAREVVHRYLYEKARIPAPRLIMMNLGYAYPGTLDLDTIGPSSPSMLKPQREYRSMG